MKTKLLYLLALAALGWFQINAQGLDKPRYQLEIHRAGTYLGMIEIELFPSIAPLATQNFDSLVNALAYDSTAFHRVVPGFVIQGGDPNSINGPKSTWGYGNPNQPTVNAEFSVVQHLRGRIGAARDADTNSANSQFYICVGSPLYLDGQYTVYGQVTSGMDIVDTIVIEPRDANDCPYNKIEMFITSIGVNDSIPIPVQLVSPPDTAQGVLDGQIFEWTTAPDAVKYRMEFSTDSTFSTLLFWKDAPLDTSKVYGFPSLATVYWRVKADNGGHYSTSNVFSFNTPTAAPVLISPPNAATGVVLNPVFEWGAVAGANEYTLQVSKNSLFTPSGIIYNQSGITGTTQQVTGLQSNYHYYWRVQSGLNGVPGNVSQKFNFYTGTSTGIVQPTSVSKNISIQTVYPNPAKNNFTVTGTVSKPCTITLSLKNVLGKIVYTATHQVTKHNYSLSIDVTGLDKGVYFLSASAGGEEVTGKVEVY